VPLSRGHQLNTYPTLYILTSRSSTGAPTRSKREVSTQNFYFTFLFIELVLLTAVASSIINIIPTILRNPIGIPTILATKIPTSANYFFNYLIIQSLGFSGSVLFQYLRILYITTIWPVRVLAQRYLTLELLNPISSIVVHANASRRSVAANNHPASSRFNRTHSFYKADPDRCGVTSIRFSRTLPLSVCPLNNILSNNLQTELHEPPTLMLLSHFAKLT